MVPTPSSDGRHPGLDGRPIYLDYNGTTPVDPRALDAALRYLTTEFGNPNAHHFAQAPRQAIADARQQLADLLGCAPGDVVFTGGGTENVAYIAALGRAAQLARDEMPTSGSRLRELRDRLHHRLDEQFGPAVVHLNGHPTQRLPNTLNVSIDSVTGVDLLAACSGLAAATGAACHEGDPDPSGVLLAMGLGPERARSAIRLTLGRWTTLTEVDEAAALLAAAHQPA